MEGNKWLELNSSPTRIGQTGPGTGAAPQPPSQPPQEPKQTEERKAGGLSTGAKIGFAGGALAVLGLGGFIALGSGGSDDSPVETTIGDGLAFGADTDTTVADTANTDTTIADDAATATTVAPSTDDATTDQNEADPDNSSAAALDDPDSPISPPGAPTNHSILANGKLYLRGALPSQEISDGITAALVPIMGGEENVVNQMVIDPTVDYTPGQSSPTYIADAVLFPTNSAEIDPQFFPLLQLGVVLLQLQPNVTIEAIGHTDSQGDDAANQQLSQARVDAWKAWMVAQGVDPDRLTATGKGETEPRADNDTAEGRQLNRRVEFIITGFEA